MYSECRGRGGWGVLRKGEGWRQEGKPVSLPPCLPLVGGKTSYITGAALVPEVPRPAYITEV